jgi:DNA-binding NtrC family response regulator
VSWNSADVRRLFENSPDPFFILNERGRLVFANPALEQAVFTKLADDEARGRLEAELLRPPADLPDEGPRLAHRAWGEGKARRWYSVVFTPIRDGSGVRVAVLGHLSKAAAPSGVEAAVDALAQERLERMREEQRSRFGFECMPARGAPMLRALHQLRLAAQSDTPVAIVGEAGVGKRTLARVLHFASERRRRNLAVLDCRMLPNEQLRRELVGAGGVSTEAAPTSAARPSGGLLSQQVGGTLVLLGAARLPFDLQELLARESDADESPRWRIVATEREPLENALADGRLARGLYYLLTRFIIQVPPLRDRTAELGDHCQWILDRLRAESPSAASAVSPDALDVLVRYRWPGNLVELESVLRTSALRTSKPILGARDLPRRLLKPEEQDERRAERAPLPQLDEMLETIERRMVELSMRLHKGNKSKAAASLGISRQRLIRRVEQEEVHRSGPPDDVEDVEDDSS